MEMFFSTYLKLLQECHNDIFKALEGFPPTALDWVPEPGMNSINVLVYHLTAAERYLIGDVIAQEPSHRDRDAEFKVHNLNMDMLVNRLAESLIYAKRVLESLTLQDLEKACLSPKDRRTVTVAWALIYALEHSATHLGHIQVTRQLWEESRR